MVAGGKPLHWLDTFRARYRLVPHGVSMSLGGEAPLDRAHLAKLKALVAQLDAPWASDHLCWSGVPGAHLHDLLPLPYTRATVERVVERVKTVQGELEVRFAVENVSSYLAYRASTMTEWEMLCEIAERADCGILLDVNNVYVSAFNHGFDAEAYIDAVPARRVVQMHLAGHTDKGRYKLDAHSAHVVPEVWALYRRACRRIGDCSTLIEWDEDIPALDVLVAEADRARAIRDEVRREREGERRAG